MVPLSSRDPFCLSNNWCNNFSQKFPTSDQKTCCPGLVVVQNLHLTENRRKLWMDTGPGWLYSQFISCTAAIAVSHHLLVSIQTEGKTIGFG
mmetsp:Transcript_10264/g.19230  ORF Transcript_10264/g.19230 Transcript_10264/m.19230 type:complete len:92 (+) Transcript_10264:1651-1926(+)